MKYVNTDGYTYSCDVIHPIEYHSPEQAAVDFEEAVRAAAKTKQGGFKFDGEEFHCSDFLTSHGYEAPQFLTIDEWFTHEANNRVLQNP